MDRFSYFLMQVGSVFTIALLMALTVFTPDVVAQIICGVTAAALASVVVIFHQFFGEYA